MNNMANNSAIEVQSKATIIKASLFAIVLAVIATLTIVLPAEYNIDPTGIGKKIGLTQLAANEQTSEPTNEPTSNIAMSKTQSGTKFGYRMDSVSIEVPAGKGLEYKFQLQQYGKLKYQWTASKALYFDFHGEPEGDTSGFFESYGIGSAAEIKGTLTTPFEGSHGWYWRNDGQEAVTVKLGTQGEYSIMGVK